MFLGAVLIFGGSPVMFSINQYRNNRCSKLFQMSGIEKYLFLYRIYSINSPPSNNSPCYG
ncbi:unnamed protein product [Meloidogyne enterolobii]|uniref:Uncharacterized protein n=1 Tax=Meloidogyne enterolobii TaxID=390850 RepID=A0ACB0XPZ7_MELEN